MISSSSVLSDIDENPLPYLLSYRDFSLVINEDFY